MRRVPPLLLHHLGPERREAGILREMTGRATNRVYVADEILKPLDAPAAAADVE